jgi:DNA-3-methyladenine glycosylase
LTAKILKRAFFERDSHVVAKELVGKNLVRKLDRDGKILKLSGIIVETEAYGYIDDQASHAFIGLTKRNSVMFGRVGFVYVYFTYGNHYCFNISAHASTVNAGAILIRAIEPVNGVEQMKKFRNENDLLNLASGPGKLTQAFCINPEHNGCDVTNDNSDIYFQENQNQSTPVICTRRIGIRKDMDRYWRFLLADKEGDNIYINKYVSKKKENQEYKIC